MLRKQMYAAKQSHSDISHRESFRHKDNHIKLQYAFSTVH